jgi:hypothetical protein
VIIDGAAMVNVIGEKEMLTLGMLPAPHNENAKLYGAGSNPLVVSGGGKLNLIFADSTELPGKLPKRFVQMVASHVTFREVVYMVSDTSTAPTLLDTTSVTHAASAPEPDIATVGPHPPAHLHGPVTSRRGASGGRSTPTPGFPSRADTRHPRRLPLVNGHPTLHHTHATRANAVDVLTAASRLGVSDPSVLPLLPRACAGVTLGAVALSHDLVLTTLDREGIYQAYRDAVLTSAAGVPLPFSVSMPLLPPAALPWDTELEVAFMGPFGLASGSPFFEAVILDSTTDFAWVLRLSDLKHTAITHLIREAVAAAMSRREWHPSTSPVRRIRFASRPAYHLPTDVTIVLPQPDGSHSTLRISLEVNRSTGGLLTKAEATLALLLLRADHYLQRLDLSLEMFHCMLLAACYSYNATPSPAHFARLSRVEVWSGIRPDISSMLAVPGSIVVFPTALEADTYGIYVHPLAHGRHQVFAFETASLYATSSVRSNVSSHTSMVHRSALETAHLFGYPLHPEGTASVLGTVILINDSYGLAPPTWNLTSLTSHPTDLGVSTDASSDDDASPARTW